MTLNPVPFLKRSGGVALLGTLLALASASAGSAQTPTPPNCPGGMRQIKIGVAAIPPNVVHTTSYLAKELGFFAKHCIDAKITAFEGGFSAAAIAGLMAGDTIAGVSDVMVASGVKVRQVWGFAPRIPHSLVSTAEITSAEQLKGKRLSASGGGVGSFNWRIAKSILAEGGLTVEDVRFVSQGTAGRLPGLFTGQLDAVPLHPEDVFLALQRPGFHVLYKLSAILPNWVFSAYGVADSFIARDRDLVVDAVAALIETNRFIYRNRDEVIPIMMRVTEKPRDAVEFAWNELTQNCVWAVNTGFDKARVEWSINNSVAAGDIPAGRNLTFDQLVDMPLAEAAVQKAGGPVVIGNCKL